jgi:hypothetical protein
MDEVTPKKKAYKKPLFWGTTLVIIIIAGLGSAYWYMQKDAVPTPPKEIIQSINNNLPLYYPSKLPEGFEAKPETISAQADNTDLITYQVSYGNGNQLFVSIQAIPDNFDFIGFYKQTIQAEEFETKNGEAYIGSLNNNSVVSLKTQDAWILVNAPGGIGATELKEVARNLRKIN